MTTKSDCAQKIAAYVAGEISHDELVQWADAALVGEQFPETDGKILLGVLSDLSASRTPTFLSKVEDYAALLRELGFRIEPKLVAA
jgi:hypothetical protein